MADNYIEQEADSFVILQEDGDKILAEDSTPGSVVPIIMQNLDQFNGGTVCAL